MFRTENGGHIVHNADVNKGAHYHQQTNCVWTLEAPVDGYVTVTAECICLQDNDGYAEFVKNGQTEMNNVVYNTFARTDI